MGEHEEKIEIMRKYLTDMSTGFYCHIGGEVPSKKINNALKTFAQGMDSDTIIGFYDTTSLGVVRMDIFLLMIKCIMLKCLKSLKSCGMTILSKYEC